MYWSPKHIVKHFNSVNISDESGDHAAISIDFTVKKKLLKRDHVSGTITVNGVSYEVSNYEVFNQYGERHPLTDGNSLWERVMQKVRGDNYHLMHYASFFHNGSLSSDLSITVNVSRDYKVVSASLFEDAGEGSKSGTVYVGPAGNKEEAMKLDQSSR